MTDGIAEGTKVEGALAKEVLTFLASQLVDEADAVEIDAVPGRRGGVEFQVRVAPGDMGKIIGRRGRVAQAVRTVVRAAGAKEGTEVNVDIQD